MSSFKQFNFGTAKFNVSFNPNICFRKYTFPIVTLGTLPVTVKILKRSSFGVDVIDVLLKCSPDICIATKQWFMDADISVSLYSPITGQIYPNSVTKMKYGEDVHCRGGFFMECRDLKQFEVNGEIFFDFELRRNPTASSWRYTGETHSNFNSALLADASHQWEASSNSVSSTSSEFSSKSYNRLPYALCNLKEVEQKRFIFELWIENISQMVENISEVEGQLVSGNTKWSVFLKRKNEYMGIFIRDKRQNRLENYVLKVNCSFKLVSFFNQKRIEKQFERKFYYEGQDWGFPHFVPWSILMDPMSKYVHDDKTIIYIELDVDEPRSLPEYIDEEPCRSRDQMFECPICLECVISRQPVISKCGHLFCGVCIMQFTHNRCPICNKHGFSDDLRTIYI